MKSYQKAQMIARNLPTGSYAAGHSLNGNSASGMYKSPKGARYRDTNRFANLLKLYVKC